ncbi:MAG: family 43 glycosylhydrolase [Clostridiales bacterium]|nr:family 43 glycosylhydrolase [Clostridiales bacterium]
MKTFRNPVSPFDAPDPFMTYDPVTGYYYALFTRGRVLELFRSRHAAEICTVGDSKVIYHANGPRDGIWGDIWAPEMHRAPGGRWYIYTSGRIREERGAPKCLFIMEALSDDPFGDWQFKCKPSPDVFSIDPTVYTAENGQQFLCCSRVDRGQVLDIRELADPWTFGPRRAMIARASYDWETVPPYNGDGTINEGAFFVESGERLFIIYSGNGCWSDHYCFGVLEYTGDDRGDPAKMCDPANWFKHDKPIFEMANGVFGPGHASFFRSPDGRELWCAYHGMKAHNETVTYAPRYFNLQHVSFDETGYPVMGEPVGYETDLVPPSGEVWDCRKEQTMKDLKDILSLADRITVNTQSSIRIEAEGRTLYFDPIEIDGTPQDADVIFVTHPHGDHFSPAAIARIRKADTVLVVPASMADKAKGAGLPLVTVVPGGSCTAGGIPCEAVPAYNPAKRFHPRENGWVGYVVTLGGIRVYVAGDTDETDEAAAVACDLALIPVGGTYTMTPAEAASLIRRMKPAAVIPTHYGSLVGKPGDGQTFASLVGDASKVLLRLG